jgi:hypothetical protein
MALGAYVLVVTSDAAAENVPSDAWFGECYDNSGSKRPVPCDGSHYYEVFSVVEYELEEDYPGAVLRRVGNPICEEDLEDATGESFLLSDYSYAEVYPTPEQWADGVRQVPCVLFKTESGPLTGRRGPGSG